MDDWMNGYIWRYLDRWFIWFQWLVAAARNPRLRHLRAIFGLGGLRHRGPRGGPWPCWARVLSDSMRGRLRGRGKWQGWRWMDGWMDGGCHDWFIDVRRSGKDLWPSICFFYGLIFWRFLSLEQISTFSPSFSSFRVASKEILIPSRETLAHSSTLLLVRGLLPLDIA